MIDVMNKKSYRPDDDVFFIISSVDKPHLYIKCYGRIIKKHSKKDNVMYLIKLQKIHTNVNEAKTHLHRRTFKTRKIDTGIAVMKKIYCLEFFDQPEFLSSNICETLNDYLFVVPSIFVAEDYENVNILYNKAKDVIQDKLRQFIYELE